MIRKIFRSIVAILIGTLAGLFILCVVMLFCAFLVHLVSPNIDVETLDIVSSGVQVFSLLMGGVGGVYMGLTWFEE